MTERPDREAYNHPHWDHRALPPEQRLRTKIAVWLRPLLRRAGLPRHLGTPLILIGCGFGYFLLVNQGLADLISQVFGGTRASLVVSMVFLLALALPGIALILGGVWNLTRGFRLPPAGSR